MIISLLLIAALVLLSNAASYKTAEVPESNTSLVSLDVSLLSEIYKNLNIDGASNLNLAFMSPSLVCDHTKNVKVRAKILVSEFGLTLKKIIDRNGIADKYCAEFKSEVEKLLLKDYGAHLVRSYVYSGMFEEAHRALRKGVSTKYLESVACYGTLASDKNITDFIKEFDVKCPHNTSSLTISNLIQRFHKAVLVQNFQEVTHMLSYGVNLDTHSSRELLSQRFINILVQNKDYLKILLDFGLSPHTRHGFLMRNAVLGKHDDAVELLLKYGFDPNRGYESDAGNLSNLILFTARTSNVAAMTLFKKYHADLHFNDEEPLYAASSADQLVMIKTLHAMGANLNVSGGYLLAKNLEACRPPIVKYLLQEGVSFLPEWFYAIKYDCAPALEIILERQKHLVQINRQQLLKQAISVGSGSCVEALLDSGADLSVVISDYGGFDEVVKSSPNSRTMMAILQSYIIRSNLFASSDTDNSE
ncbi:hypothetical protein MP638_005211 [Amoeboaphelidium occidentale]|nr:hypothetical protein MP638_005211 [Amoeboaphelidium occidentale]